MSWIKTILPEAATGKLKDIYEQVNTPGQRVDNILQLHSLRPHTLEGHMKLYKNVLHHSSNTLPKWFLETIGIYVSILNNCSYCIDHHYAGLKKLLKEENHKVSAIRSALEEDDLDSFFSGKELLLLHYAKKLTLFPSSVQKQDIELLQNNGIDDGEILEVNQVISYFCYANRTVLGLGATTAGDDLGLSPGNNENPDDWRHY